MTIDYKCCKDTENVVYKITFFNSDYDDVYIGYTTNKLYARINSHKSKGKTNPDSLISSRVSEAIENKETINVEVLYEHHESCDKSLRIVESKLIEEFKYNPNYNCLNILW